MSGARDIGAAVAAATRRLAGAGVGEPRREARLLVALALDGDVTQVLGFPERALPPSAERRLEEMLSRRELREPISRIAGYREFWSLRFALSTDTLDPRPDSETLIEAALAEIGDQGTPLRLLDLGTGTGCLLLALLRELPKAWGIGVDIAAGAIATARRNAACLGLAGRAGFVVGNWGAALRGPVDVILANPPYIASKVIEGLAPEVARHEPRRALDGGPDGLAAYRVLAQDAARLLAPGGVALFELGAGQAGAVAGLMGREGLVSRGVRRDLSGIARCLVTRHSGDPRAPWEWEP